MFDNVTAQSFFIEFGGKISLISRVPQGTENGGKSPVGFTILTNIKKQPKAPIIKHFLVTSFNDRN